MKRTYWLIPIGLIALAATVLLAASGAFSSAMPVQTAVVRRDVIREFIDEQAVTRLPRTYLVTMPQAGRIEPITLDEGARVTKGQSVAQIVPADLDLEVTRSRSVVERLEAAINKNADNSVEETALRQTKELVDSMKATVAAAFARVEAGRAGHDYSQKHLDRIRGLFATGAQTQDDLDRAQLQDVEASSQSSQDELVASAAQSMEAAARYMPTMAQQYINRKTLDAAVLEKEKAEAAARLRQVERDQERGTMTSPVDGVVLRRTVTNEQFLPAGQELLEIGRLEDLQVEADILSLDVVEVQPGDRAEIYGPAVGQRPEAGTLRPIRGTVTRVFPAGFTKISSLGVEQQRVKVIVALDPDDLAWLRQERNLGVGYRVRVKVFTGEKPGALVVPRAALFRSTAGLWQLYAVRDGYARLQDIQIGMMNDEEAEVLQGLAEGDLVVLAPDSSLTDGQRVE